LCLIIKASNYHWEHYGALEKEAVYPKKNFIVNFKLQKKHMSLFGTSGIRGEVDSKLSPQFCLEIGRAIGSTLPIASRVCLATDTRTSRDVIKTALASGLLATGINVTDLGILPTPALARLTRELKCGAGIMITASHNPPSYNGIKLFNGDSLGFSTPQEEEVEKRYLHQEFRDTTWREHGHLDREENAVEKYIAILKQQVSSWKLNSHIKLVIDPGNGAASQLAPALFHEMGFDSHSINSEPDGLFPGRGAEPTPGALEKTVQYLRNCQADLAICFDGDADRAVFCDREGFLGYDNMVAFISALAVKASGKNKVVTTVETGGLLDAALARINASVIRTTVGDVAVAHATRELDAAIGVEAIGVYIMPEAGYYPESFLSALLLLSNIADVTEIRGFSSHLPQLHSDKRKIPCPAEIHQQVMQYCREKSNQIKAKSNYSDGIRLDFPEGWLLIRPSGTEPVIRIIAEASSESRMKEISGQGQAWVSEALVKYSGART
jgi:phosphoglucosamine mutase